MVFFMTGMKCVETCYLHIKKTVKIPEIYQYTSYKKRESQPKYYFAVSKKWFLTVSYILSSLLALNHNLTHMYLINLVHYNINFKYINKYIHLVQYIQLFGISSISNTAFIQNKYKTHSTQSCKIISQLF